MQNLNIFLNTKEEDNLQVFFFKFNNIIILFYNKI